MQYLRAYKYVFEHPKWMTNLLLAGVCMLIPAIGGIVLSGWLYETIETMHRRGDKDYPAFDFGKFVAYLTRGVWPFLVSLVLGAFAIPIVLAFMGAFFYVMASSGGKPNEGLVLGVTIGYVVLMVLFSFVLSIFATPIVLRAGLMQEFSAAFSFAFVKDFVAKMWVETLLTQLFLLVSSLVVVAAGYLACCVGIIPAQALIVMASTHLHWQLYELYLQRGGMAIPLKEPVPPEPA